MPTAEISNPSDVEVVMARTVDASVDLTTERWGPEWPETVNTVELSALGERTLVTHTMRFPSKAARDEAMKTAMADGMEQSFERLDDLVRSREFAGADPAE